MGCLRSAAGGTVTGAGGAEGEGHKWGGEDTAAGGGGTRGTWDGGGIRWREDAEGEPRDTKGGAPLLGWGPGLGRGGAGHPSVRRAHTAPTQPLGRAGLQDEAAANRVLSPWRGHCRRGRLTLVGGRPREADLLRARGGRPGRRALAHTPPDLGGSLVMLEVWAWAPP